RRVPRLNQALYRGELAVRHRVAQSRARESALAGLTTGHNAIVTWLANARRSRPHADDLKAGGAAFSGWVATNGTHAQSGFSRVATMSKAFTDRVAATGNGLRQRFAASSDPWTAVYDEPPRVDPVEEIYRLNLYQPRKRSRIKVTRRRSARIKRLVMAATVLGTGVLALGVVSGAIMYASIESDFVPLDRLVVNQPASGAVVLDRNGELLYRYGDEATGFREPVSLDDISEHLLA